MSEIREIREGAICQVRGSSDDWQVVGTRHDGHVLRYNVQSRYSGKLRWVFKHELYEKDTSTYQELNQFLEDASNMDFLFDDNFEFEEVSVGLDQGVEAAVASEHGENTIQPPKKRFKSITDEQISHLKLQNNEKTTQRQTTWAVTMLKAWMVENGDQREFEFLATPLLDALLESFYAALQSKKGADYSKSALVSIRAGVNRHLTSPPFSRALSLMKDRDFLQSNQVLTRIIKDLKRKGKDISKHKEPISEEDVTKLYESGLFSEDSPETLQNKVLYEVISQFGRRGREGLHHLKKTAFVEDRDAKGRRYIKMAYNEADKTHHGVDGKENLKEARMYETGEVHCPLRSLLKYTSKLNPQCESFFQRPLTKYSGSTEVWYANKAVGVNKLFSFMGRLSEDAKLSRTYTNHCIRAFVTTRLHNKGFSARSIMSVTGHRNAESLTSYIRPSDDERQRVSNELTFKPKQATASSHSVTDQSVSLARPAVSTTATSSANTVDINVSKSELDARAFHVFSGNITSSTITMNIYNAK